MYGSDIWGHANNWGYVAGRHGFTVDSNPAVGAVAWTSSDTNGHVAWVCAVNGDYITIDEYNNGWVTISGEYHGNHQYGTRTVHKSNFQYIHVKDLPSEERGSEISGGNRTISDGDYHIVSALEGDRFNPGQKCLDVANADTLLGTNVQQWSDNGK